MEVLCGSLAKLNGNPSLTNLQKRTKFLGSYVIQELTLRYACQLVPTIDCEFAARSCWRIVHRALLHSLSRTTLRLMRYCIVNERSVLAIKQFESSWHLPLEHSVWIILPAYGP